MVAHKPGGDGGLMPAIAQRYAAADGRPRIEIVVGGWAEQSVMVRSGRADVAVVRDLFDRRGLDVEPLLTEPRCAVLARGHRLADAPVLTRADLSGEPVPVWPQATARHTAFRAGVDHLPEGMVRFGGVVPVTGSGEIGGSLAADGTAADPAAPIHIPDGPEVHDFAQLAEVVALGLGVAFLPASAAELYPRSDLVYVPVRDVTPSNVLVVWPSHSTSRAVAAFVQAALDAAASVRVDSVREGSARSD
jgi:DNA-binding transcriptional LysR family regulator